MLRSYSTTERGKIGPELTEEGRMRFLELILDPPAYLSRVDDFLLVLGGKGSYGSRRHVIISSPEEK